MPPRSFRRPVLSACGHLIHGTVTVEDREARRTRPVASAVVTVMGQDGVAAAATTQRDGSYTVVIGSCRRHDSGMELHVEKRGPCETINATRLIQLQANSDVLLWQQDVRVQARETTSVCEVTKAKSAPKDANSSLLQQQDIEQLISGVSIVLSLVWGFVLLWAIAKWTTVHQPRQAHWISDDECELPPSRLTEKEVLRKEKTDQERSVKRVKRTIRLENSPKVPKTKRSGRRVIQMIEDDSCDE